MPTMVESRKPWVRCRCGVCPESRAAGDGYGEPMGTTSRTMRFDDDLWAAAHAKAQAERRTVTSVCADALADYVDAPPRTLSERLRAAAEATRAAADELGERGL